MSVSHEQMQSGHGQEVGPDKIAFQQFMERDVVTQFSEYTEMKRRLAQLEAGWVRVEDGLPEEFGWFLVLDEFLAGNDKQTMGFFEGADSPVRWLPLDGRDDPDSMRITHWMPLPTQPGGE